MDLIKKSYPISALDPGMIVAEDISIQDGLGITIFSVSEGTSLTDAIIKKLKQHGIGFINIYTGAFGSEVDSFSDDEMAFISALPVVEAKGLLDNKLKSALLDNIRAFFEIAKIHGMLDTDLKYRAAKSLDATVDTLINIVLNAYGKKLHVTDMKSYDDYIFHHSLSVATLSLAIGKELGLGFWILRKLGRAAIMHDIGKMKLSEELLLKSDTFTSQDYALVKEHSQLGATQLRQLGINDTDIRDAVLHHHEKYNGTGYPSKLLGEKIPLFSRIISIADVFDALTSHRPHREALSTPANVIEIIMSEANVSFDLKIVQAFLAIIDIYPINSMVSLSDDRMAFVHARSRHPLRPIVKILDTGEEIDLSEREYLSLVITELRG